MTPVTCTILVPSRNPHGRIVAQLAALPSAFRITREVALAAYTSVSRLLRDDQGIPLRAEDPPEVIVANCLMAAHKYLGRGHATPFTFTSPQTCVVDISWGMGA